MEQRIRLITRSILLGAVAFSATACGNASDKLGAGDRALSAADDANADAICTEPPTVEGKTIFLWPPNHKMHSIAVADCVSAANACDGSVVSGEFIWASSDEPVNDLGDGNFAPDILIDDCNQVSVRAERQGPKDGRVYKLGVRAIDAAGNVAESECTIIVDHDQRGVDGADSGESYRITLDGTSDTPVCGEVPPPVTGDGDGDTGDGDGDTGDGDGDTGDGDGDTGDGDGDTGDGDGDTGDGDGDVPPGDGDGDVPPGDGDGDGGSSVPPVL